VASRRYVSSSSPTPRTRAAEMRSTDRTLSVAACLALYHCTALRCMPSSHSHIAMKQSTQCAAFQHASLDPIVANFLSYLELCAHAGLGDVVERVEKYDCTRHHQLAKVSNDRCMYFFLVLNAPYFQIQGHIPSAN